MTDPVGPYAGFHGEVARTLGRSRPWWPQPPSPPGEAPNIVIVLADDLGYADLGCYGSEIATPNLDRIAGEGLPFTNFHATPMCSPTRAALLTGVNPHLAGVGDVAHNDRGFPGYANELSPHAATLPEILRDHGYATLMVGKWHLSKDTTLNEAGPTWSWPIQRGFDRFYGILDAYTNLHHPHRIIADNHVVPVDRYPDDYYFTDDLTAEAVRMIRGVKAGNPSRPFLLYLAHASVHAPLHARREDIERYRGVYDDGWDVLRRTRFERQKRLGVCAPDTRLPPRNSEAGHDVATWEDLGPRERELFARYMEVYAAMVDNLDQNFGVLRAALEEMGEWERTLVLFLSDNGASREGQELGTTSYHRTLFARDRDELAFDHERIDLVGGPRSLAHYPRGWAMASNTPFRLYKINTHAGGHQVPFLMSWPERLRDHPGTWRRQYVHVTDIVPTVCDLLGITAPEHRRGFDLLPWNGTSFRPALYDPDAPTTHHEQYYESWGHRGYHRDGWDAVTLHQPGAPFSDEQWELFDLDADPTQTRNLSQEYPGRVAELREAFDKAAWANQVYPLDEGVGLKGVIRPETDSAFETPVVLYPGIETLEWHRSLQLVSLRSFQAVVMLDYAKGDQGVLLAHGDQGGGYALYIEDDRLVYVHNNCGAMGTLDCGLVPDRTQVVELAVTAGAEEAWNVAVSIDSEVVGEGGFKLPARVPHLEGIDVGIDRRSPVSWDVYERHGPFPFTGTLHSVTIKPGAYGPDRGPAVVERLYELAQRYD